MKILKWLWIPIVIILSIIVVLLDSTMDTIKYYKLLDTNILNIDIEASLARKKKEEEKLKNGLETIRAKINPLKNPILHLGLAENFGSHKASGFLQDEAIKEYKNARDLDLKNPLPYIGMIETYRKGNYEEKSEEILQLINEAIQIEMDNAYYYYCRGWLLLEKGIEYGEWDKELGVDKVIIKDADSVEKGLTDIILGNEKRYYNVYSVERGKSILALYEKLGIKTSPFEKAEKVFSAMPSIVQQLKIGKILVALSKEYEKSGDLTKAENCLKAIPVIGQKIAQKSRFIIELLVATAIQDLGESALKKYYTRREMAKESSYYDFRLEGRKKLREEEKQLSNEYYEFEFGLLDSVIIPIGGWNDYNPAIGRRLDYSLIAGAMLAMLYSGIIIFILVVLVGWLYTYWRGKRYQLASFNARWQIKDFVVIYLGGLVIPLFFYFLYDRTHYLREYGMGHLGGLVVFQIVTIVFLSLILLVLLTALRLRKGITANTGGIADNLKKYALLVYLGFAMILSYFWIGTNWRDDFYAWLLLGLGIIAIILTVVGWIASLRQAKTREEIPVVYQRRILYYKSLLLILGWGLIILIVIHLTITKPYYERALKVYETTVIGRIIEDEIGMTKWKALRDLAQDKESGNK